MCKMCHKEKKKLVTGKQAKQWYFARNSRLLETNFLTSFVESNHDHFEKKIFFSVKFDTLSDKTMAD